MILVNGTLEIADTALETLIPMIRDAMTATHQEEGCLVYRFTRDLDSPNLIHIVELWESEAALQAHMQGAAFREVMQALSQHARIVSFAPRQGELREFNLVLPQ